MQLTSNVQSQSSLNPSAACFIPEMSLNVKSNTFGPNLQDNGQARSVEYARKVGYCHSEIGRFCLGLFREERSLRFELSI